jgi:hypothetical protein
MGFRRRRSVPIETTGRVPGFLFGEASSPWKK